jgi:hypothetical protein
MEFLKSHLRGGHYNWESDFIHSLYNDEPDRRIFNRYNGKQVLFIINYFGKSLGTLTLSEGLKLEELIITQLPEQTKSELAVFNWLRGIYLYYGN